MRAYKGRSRVEARKETRDPIEEAFKKKRINILLFSATLTAIISLIFLLVWFLVPSVQNLSIIPLIVLAFTMASEIGLAVFVYMVEDLFNYKLFMRVKALLQQSSQAYSAPSIQSSPFPEPVIVSSPATQVQPAVASSTQQPIGQRLAGGAPRAVSTSPIRVIAPARPLAQTYLQLSQEDVTPVETGSRVVTGQAQLPSTPAKVCPLCRRELPFGDLHIICPFCGTPLK